MARRAQTTISLTPDLKARMEEYGEGVNWSAVACEAFEAKLAEIISTREVRDMRDVIQRIRATKRVKRIGASKAKTIVSDAKEGREAGRRWAKQFGEFAQFRRLAQLREEMRGDLESAYGGSSAYSWGDHLYATLEGTDLDREESAEFWEHVLGKRSQEWLNNSEFMLGFTEGVLDIWDAVEDQI